MDGGQMQRMHNSLWLSLSMAGVLAVALIPQGSPSASAAPAPTPTVPNIIGEPTPEPEPSSSATPKPSGGGDPRPRDGDKPTAERKDRRKAPLGRMRDGDKRHRRAKGLPRWVKSFQTVGSYSSSALDGAALQLRALGVGHRASQYVYVGVPVAGATTWTDSWGAPRHEFGRHFRRHEGQDIFCTRGAPVLAVADGHVEFDTVELGGKIARLHLANGDYWYYAHLTDWNTEDLQTGDRVTTGAVIGSCGTTGNAVGTPPHVHFGWYSSGSALNPIAHLSRWLSDAEVRADRLVRTVRRQRVRNIVALRAERLFGDAFTVHLAAPDPGTTIDQFLDMLLVANGDELRGM